MGAVRENTLVVDFSVLPKRPDASAVEKFMYGELKLDLADVVNIQLHNVRNLVYVEMVDIATATRYHSSHHLQRVMKVDKQEFKIPVYVEDGAVNVRVHDFPPRTANTVLKEHLQQFGTILSISREKWKNHFPGVYNGVRVVRMRLTKPIPSYQTIDGETTLVTYRNQTKTCKYCGRKAHPRQKCTISGKSNTAKDTDNTDSANFAASDFPTLGDDQQKQQQQPLQQQQRKQSTTETTVDQTAQQTQSNEENNNSDVEWIDTIDSDSDEALTNNNNKRRLSTKREENELKRKTANQGNQKHDRKRTDQVDNNKSKNKKSGKNG